MEHRPFHLASGDPETRRTPSPRRRRAARRDSPRLNGAMFLRAAPFQARGYQYPPHGFEKGDVSIQKTQLRPAPVHPAPQEFATTMRRVFHRLPNAALLSGGIAPVDSPWKTLIGAITDPASGPRTKPAAATVDQSPSCCAFSTLRPRRRSLGSRRRGGRRVGNATRPRLNGAMLRCRPGSHERTPRLTGVAPL